MKRHTIVFLEDHRPDTMATFVDLLNEGWEIVRCDTTKDVMVYILSK